MSRAMVVTMRAAAFGICTSEVARAIAARPNGPALSCRPPVHQDATTDGRPASPPRTRAAGGLRAWQSPAAAAGQLQRLVRRRPPRDDAEIQVEAEMKALNVEGPQFGSD